MKNSLNSLIIIFLFSIFFANMANAKESIKIIPNQKIQINTNEKLVDDLAASKTFEIYYMKIVALSMNKSLASVGVTDQDQKTRDLKLQNIISHISTISDSEYKDVSEIMGFNNVSSFQQFSSRIDQLKNQLLMSFPEIKLLEKNEAERIFGLAIEKAKLQEKVESLLTRDECFNNAWSEYGSCKTAGKWFKGILIVGLVICIVAAVVTGLIIAVGTAGTTTLAVSAAILAMATGCTTFIFGDFALANPYDVGCNNTLSTRTSACVSQFGDPTGAGTGSGN